MDIQVIVKQRHLTISKKAVKDLVKDFIECAKVAYDEVCIHFVDTPTICALHADFFNDPTPTDCISFPMDDSREATGYHAMGDVFVCPETALQYTQRKGGDPYHEITLYVIHGLLHLLGYDDIAPDERKAMRAAEKKCLTNIAKKNLWLRP